jgi:hypothetical protein
VISTDSEASRFREHGPMAVDVAASRQPVERSLPLAGLVVLAIGSGLDRSLVLPALPHGFGFGDARLVCEDDGLNPISEIQLLKDVRDVRLDGGLADVELLADFGIG